jgi:hypothetical protein
MTAKIDHCGCGLRCANNMEMETGDLEYRPIPHGATEGAGIHCRCANEEVMYSSNCAKQHKQKRLKQQQLVSSAQ